MKKAIKKDQKGFTLIELIIVIAVMGIIAAVLVPSFAQMTAKARVSTDIRSIQMVQNQLDIYLAEHNDMYPDANGEAIKGKDESGKITVSADDVVKGLVAGGYLEEKSTEGIQNPTTAQKIGLQSKVNIVWDNNKPTNLALGGGLDSTVDKILVGLEGGLDKNFVNSNPSGTDSSR